jgi:drug/metabolite transporter (DMT)-like permease
MLWTTLALLAPALWAVSNLIDADLLELRIRHASTLVALTGVVAGVPGVLLLLLGRAAVLDARSMAIIGVAGMLGLAVYYPYFRALQTTSPLDVLLLWNLAPIFVAVVAGIILREQLDLRQIAGGASLLGSSVVALLQRGEQRIRPRAAGWMLLASLLVGGEAVGEKATYVRASFVSGFAWLSLIQLGLAVLLMALHRPARREVRSCLKSSVVRIVAGNETINLAASAARSMAVSLGPVSIVHAIGALQPVLLIGAARVIGRGRGTDRASRTFPHRIRVAFSIALAVLGMGLIESGR